MSNMSGQNNNRRNPDSDLMRIRGLDQTGRGDGQGDGQRRNQQFDPGRAAFRELNNQGQGRGNGTDAPPPYDAGDYHAAPPPYDAPPTYQEAVQGDNRRRNGRSGFNWRQFGRVLVIADMMSNVSVTDALLISAWARNKDGSLNLGKAVLLYDVARTNQQYNQQADAYSRNRPLEFFLEALRGKDEHQTTVKEVDADDPNSAAFKSGFEASKQEANVDYANASDLKNVDYTNASALSDDGWEPGEVSW
ncbi:MAG TPA: hypothetical protein VHV10_16885 [Ktedonobacteraceae bacterium]|nr:hypothetical protein [Ktedonobacteraceae bacterium]